MESVPSRMMNSNRNTAGESQRPHRCGECCLGPLTFHDKAVGSMVRLSDGGRRASRSGKTFKNGLVFLSRQVRVQERVRLRVEKSMSVWHGGLRLGFSTVPPAERVLPLPSMAIPNLTDVPGHWAVVVDESLRREGAQLEFWVTKGGGIYVGSDGQQHKVRTGVNVSLPLWAFIDLYGHTCCVSLMGSEKKELFCTRKSCPVPKCITSPDADTRLSPTLPLLLDLSDYEKAPAGEGHRSACVVCLLKTATVTLPCTHRCLCNNCAPRVLREFDTCPLCRQSISRGWDCTF